MDLRNYWEVLHVNMVKIRGLQDKVIAKVVQITTLPVQLEGPTVPIRYVMPRGEPIELWDSGFAIHTEPGDTVRNVAQRYAVAFMGGGADQRCQRQYVVAARSAAGHSAPSGSGAR